ncbi:hypothetical protein BGZ96_002345 [Linnemannia gamsii]|uniref:Uncharacterized protein n=1 Tax=Linnemannia gamsii TaxID=64522 RepID=A0ABQ7K9N6_9FUNG|nr:hypothetical protein BGZ96_002345 [Linnemannia gamsii]
MPVFAPLPEVNVIKEIFHSNPYLPSLTLHRPVGKISSVEAAMEAICFKLPDAQVPYAISSYTLIDNTEDHLSATFNLSSNQDPKSIVANVTVRHHGRSLDRFNPFVRNLNANDKLGPETIKTLYYSIVRKGTVVVDTLESLEVNQMVHFIDEWNKKAWITQMQESLPSSSTLIVLDQFKDLRRIVLGYDDASLGWLKDRQVAHLSGAVSQGSSKESPVNETTIQNARIKSYAEVEYKAFRLLGNEQSTTKHVPIINDDLGQVVLEKDIAKKYVKFDHVESSGRLTKYPDNRNEVYEVSFTPYTGDGPGDQGSQ